MLNSTKVHLLIKGCRIGKRSSQLELYKHFYGYGMSIALRFSNSKEDAFEVLNDGFLKVFLKIDQYNEDFAFKPWLRKIIVRSAVDHYRKYKEKNITLDSSRITKSYNSSYNFALDQLAFDDLIKLLQQLTPGYRMVLMLFAVEGMKHSEIAEQLDISVGTSKSNLAKARMKLKTILEASHTIPVKSKGNG